MSAAIVWFRRDLRLTDNPALDAAVRTGLPLVALYVHAPDEEGEWRPGAASDWWLQRSLLALDARLREHGGRLVVRRGPTLDALRRVVAETDAVEVHWNRLYEPALFARDQQVKAALRGGGLEAHSHNAALLVEPWDVQTQGGQPYRVFTPFWRNAQTRFVDASPLPAPDAIKFAAVSESVAIESLELTPQLPWDAGLRANWTPGEVGALSQMGDFVDIASDYASARDRPDLPGTSRLSPHLHFGEISPRQVLAVLQRAAVGQSVGADRFEPFVRELGWREFAHHLLFHFPSTATQNLNPAFDAFPWATTDRRLLRAWQCGRTGIPIVDAGMRELWQTGWMHNRVRMMVASLLTKNLRYHWLHGARWFWDTLVDADLAANTLGWQWSAGTGADAAPYFRIFNPVLQGQRFDPDGAYVKRFVPELAHVPKAFVHRPWALRPVDQADFGVRNEYAQPLIDLATTRAAALSAYAQRKPR